MSVFYICHLQQNEVHQKDQTYQRSPPSAPSGRGLWGSSAPTATGKSKKKFKLNTGWKFSWQSWSWQCLVESVFFCMIGFLPDSKRWPQSWRLLCWEIWPYTGDVSEAAPPLWTARGPLLAEAGTAAYCTEGEERGVVVGILEEFHWLMLFVSGWCLPAVWQLVTFLGGSGGESLSQPLHQSMLSIICIKGNLDFWAITNARVCRMDKQMIPKISFVYVHV